MSKTKNAVKESQALLDTAIEETAKEPATAKSQEKPIVSKGRLIESTYCRPSAICYLALEARHNARVARSADARKGAKAKLAETGPKHSGSCVLTVAPCTDADRVAEFAARKAYYDNLPDGQKKAYADAGYLEPDTIEYTPVNGLQRSNNAAELAIEGKWKPDWQWRIDVMDYESDADLFADAIALNELEAEGKLAFTMPERLTAAEHLFAVGIHDPKTWNGLFKPGTGRKLLAICKLDRDCPKDKIIERIRRFWADEADGRAKPRGIDLAKIDQASIQNYGIPNPKGGKEPMSVDDALAIINVARKRTLEGSPKTTYLAESKVRDLGKGTKCPLVRFVCWSLLQGDHVGLANGLTACQNSQNLDAPANYFGTVQTVATLPEDEE